MILLYLQLRITQSTTELILLATICPQSPPIFPREFTSYIIKAYDICTPLYQPYSPICLFYSCYYIYVCVLLLVLLPLLLGWKSASVNSYLFYTFYLKLLHMKESLARCVIPWLPLSFWSTKLYNALSASNIGIEKSGVTCFVLFFFFISDLDFLPRGLPRGLFFIL